MWFYELETQITYYAHVGSNTSTTNQTYQNSIPFTGNLKCYAILHKWMKNGST